MDFWPGDNEPYHGHIIDSRTQEVKPAYTWLFDQMADYMLTIIEDPNEYPLRFRES